MYEPIELNQAQPEADIGPWNHHSMQLHSLKCGLKKNRKTGTGGNSASIGPKHGSEAGGPLEHQL